MQEGKKESILSDAQSRLQHVSEMFVSHFDLPLIPIFWLRSQSAPASKMYHLHHAFAYP